MSFNSLVDQSYHAEIGALQSFILSEMEKWTFASTREERLLIESRIIGKLDRLSEDIQRLLVRPGTHPTLQEFSSYYEVQDQQVKLALTKIENLGRKFLSYFNTQQARLLELTSKLRRINQKYATLTLWDAEESKWAYAEKFLVIDQLSSEYSSEAECFVDTDQGVLTLPISSTKKLLPSRVRIGEGSNGVPGNSDLEVQLNNSKPSNLINGNDADWFEYERLDSGPLNLVLLFEFAQEQIINRILLEPIAASTGNFNIKDISYTGSQGSFTLRELLPDIGVSKLTNVSVTGNDTHWQVSHLPVKAKTVLIQIEQTASHRIELLNRSGGRVSRTRFGVGIKKVEFYQLQYLAKGEINSEKIRMPGKMFAALPYWLASPQHSSLYSKELILSFDSGASWTNNLIDGDRPSTGLVPGGTDHFVWKLSLEREEGAFAKLDTLTSDTVSGKAQTILRSVSKAYSPIEIPLESKPIDGKVYCTQPGIMRRSFARRGVVLGHGSTYPSTFEMPIDVISGGVSVDEVHVQVGNQYWERVGSHNELVPGTWMFSDGYKSISLPGGISGLPVKVSLSSEQMALEQRSDGFFYKMAFDFDPDPNTIKIRSYPREPKQRSLIVQQGKKVFSLGAQDIVDSDLQITSLSGTTYSAVSSLDKLDGPGTYYVDRARGVVEFGDIISGDTAKVTFQHYTSREIPQELFEVVYEDGKPWGIKLKPEALEALDSTEVVSGGLGVTLNTEGSGQREDSFSSQTAKVLTHRNLIRGSVTVSEDLFGSEDFDSPEEVTFVDGYSEFTGLLAMSEIVPEVPGDPASGIGQFLLSAGSLTENGLGLIFSPDTYFKEEVNKASLANTLGKYHVDTETGIVSVWVGPGGNLPSGITVNYMYRDPSFDPTNKYSVDYKNGILYSYSPLDPSGTISYKSAQVRVEYDLAREVPNYTYRPNLNTVKIRTEDLLDINSLVRVVWIEKASNQSVQDLKDYFSPIVSLIGFRFN